MAASPAPTPHASRGPDDPALTALITQARNGDRQAWDQLVDRYAPLIWAICRRHRLAAADARDAAQTVWLHLADHLHTLRDPGTLPGWVATTTRRECGRIPRAARPPGTPADPPAAGTIADQHPPAAEHDLPAAGPHAALREAFRQLPASCQQLLTLLTADPPLPHAEISAKLGIPAGSIAPARRRCLDNLRRHPAITTLINTDT